MQARARIRACMYSPVCVNTQHRGYLCVRVCKHKASRSLKRTTTAAGISSYLSFGCHCARDIYMQCEIHIHVCLHIYVHTYIHIIHIRTHAHTHTHTHTHTQTHTRILAYIQSIKVFEKDDDGNWHPICQVKILKSRLPIQLTV